MTVAYTVEKPPSVITNYPMHIQNLTQCRSSGAASALKVS
jgi:hypothetical protein